MKKKVVLLIMALITIEINGQPDFSGKLILSIEKNIPGKDGTTASYRFMPEKGLKIKTSEGRTLISHNFQLLDSAIVMVLPAGSAVHEPDTIPLGDISVIRGKIYGNTGRKIGGGIHAISGPVGA